MKTLLCCILTLLLAGCGNPAGTPCQVSGSGFTASHDCRHRCLSLWRIDCPDGRRITPGTCSGSFECTPGSCPDGQYCYHDNDPFDDRSFCLLADTCGVLSATDLQAWEHLTVARQHDVITARLEKQARQKKWREENPDKIISAPAVDSAPADQ